MPLDLLSVIPLDYPNSPAINDTWTGANGVVYTFDGTKWTVSGSGGAVAYLPLSGGTMTGPLALAADPTTNPQAANKHYVDASINLAGNYLGTWSVAANTPNISAGGSISNANYVATTVVAGTPETVPVGVPGIAGMSVANGDRIIWAAGLGVWQILRNAGVTLAAADARYYAITNPSGYQTAANVTTALAPYAPLASPALTGTPTAPTPGVTDNTTKLATTAYVTTADNALRLVFANNTGRNRLHNGGFSINQRGYTSGTALAAGAYGHDRWKAGASGGTYTFTQSQPFTTITITAGSLQQIVEAPNVEGGTYTLSWTGTAQGRVNAGAYGASPVTVAGLAVNTAITVEFNAGTLGTAQLEVGLVATPYAKRDPEDELARCQRFYVTGNFNYFTYGGAGTPVSQTASFLVGMRASPTMTQAITGSTNSGSISVAPNNGLSWVTQMTPAATGAVGAYGTFTASADL